MSKKPLWDALEGYYKQEVYPLHTPGHKGGRGMNKEFRELFGRPALAMDVSLMSELDDLHCPQGCLREAQELAAQLYGADASFFAVNGTTGAIHAMLLGTLQPGDEVLVPRNAHRSVFGALVLGGLSPVYVLPEYNKKWALSLQVTPEEIERTLIAHPKIKAVFLTSPNYYGLAADVARIVQLCHERRVLVLVDEAHGPHLGFSKGFPPSALQCGADAVAQSTHKLVGALTQCSMLHVCAKHVDPQRVSAAMSMLSTTSPNYWFLASLDLARAQLAEHGAAMARAALEAAEKLRAVLADIPYLRVLERELVGEGGVVDMDRTKVTVNVNALGMTGAQVAERLRAAGVAVELVDRDNVLFLVTYADITSDYDAALDAIARTLLELANEAREPLPLIAGRMPLPFPVLPPAKAYYAVTEEIPFATSAGEIAAEQINFYPPGIPVVVPGERITREIVDYCLMMQKAHIAVSGLADGSLQKIRVVKR